MLSVIADDPAQGELRLELDELFGEGARRMLAAALEAEVDAYLATHAAERDERGRRLVVRNGHAPARTITSGVGQVEVVRPRVDDRRVDATTGARVQFHSMLLPRWCRRSPKVAEVLPLLYLHGLSGGDFVPALEAFFGTAAGLSASVITRLVEQWQAERAAFARRDLRGVDYVSCWADGVHCNVRLGDQGRLCCLVIVGVRADGRKELVAIADGERESTDAWAELLGELRRRGLRAPVVMVGDGALGLWRALGQVFPATREQRCWVPRSRKESTCRRAGVRGGGRGRHGDQEFCGGAIAGRCRCGGVPGLFTEDDTLFPCSPLRSPTSWARCPRASTPAHAGRSTRSSALRTGPTPSGRSRRW
jgi:putative transposase